jgi:hypothetical protein
VASCACSCLGGARALCSLTRGLAWRQKREHNQPLFGLEDFAQEHVEAKKREVEEQLGQVGIKSVSALPLRARLHACMLLAPRPHHVHS